MTLELNLPGGSYDVIIERGALERSGELLNLNRRVLIVTDDGVPSEYSKKIASFCAVPIIVTVAQGEDSKSAETYLSLLKTMLKHEFDRGDCVVAVGGGVVGDLSGFVASSYMRGVDFYNIPTTLLSQIDSSIGGKTAINFEGIKNIVGAFYQPKRVLIDPNVLKTLPRRQISCGLSEAIKMACTFDLSLFELIKAEDIDQNIEEIIIRSLKIKQTVVEQDEKEAGLRKVLNFGHTIGHGIESEQKGSLYHGECVALGMIAMCSPSVSSELIPVLKKADLPTEFNGDLEKVCSAMLHDKKAQNGKVSAVIVDEIGSYRMAKLSINELKDRLTVFGDKI